MIGQNPKAEVAPFSSAEIEKKEISFEDGGHRERTGESHTKLRAKKQNRVSGQQLEWPDVLKLPPKFQGKWKNLGQEDDRRLQAKLYKIPLARK